MCLHMLGIQKSGIPFLRLVGDLGKFLLGKPEALIVFLIIFVTFQDLEFSLGT
jgi:hypothetical protein